MSVTYEALERLESHWAVSAIAQDQRLRALELTNARLVHSAAGRQVNLELNEATGDDELLQRLATAYEIAAIEGLDALLYSSSEGTEHLREQAQAGAHRAFGIRRILAFPEEYQSRVFHVLHLSTLAYSGDRWADLRRWFQENASRIEIPSPEDATWDQRLLENLYGCWVRLFRKNGWDDLSEIAQIVGALRQGQQRYEPEILRGNPNPQLHSLAYRLVALYHWAKATELLALYMLQGEPAGIPTELDQHFEAAHKAAMASNDPGFEVLLRWLHIAGRRMVAGSVWWVAQAVNSRVTRFVQHMTRSRGLFELLPPQRAALQEQGLLDQANRALVIDMPTSGGKTFLAEFRILQALNQYIESHGWVAYVAPTRALVAQLTRRLREDLGPVGIRVEQLSAAVEIDGIEEALLGGDGQQGSFEVLVSTPEKMHLIIRNKKVPFPLALVVMDEAHNIEDEERGLRIELLLATIKRDCPTANFLLLMPDVSNAADLASWLSPEAGKTISLGTSAWQPNERVVGMYKIEKVTQPRGGWSLHYEILTTTPKTLDLRGNYRVGPIKPLDISYSKAVSLTTQTAAIAKVFSERGTSIAVARTIPHTWLMARTVAHAVSPMETVCEEVGLVQRFLSTEISPNFELIELLSRGVAVHHAGLSDEVRSLIEWLAESGKLRVLCATTTIAQGINFPVSSVFLASRMLPVMGSKEMSKRAFWNLAGRAGRINQDSIGIVGLAAGEDPNAIRGYVSEATGDLVSRLVKLLDDVESVGQLSNLSLVIDQEQWTDFRSYVAHLWNESRSLDTVIADSEQLLRNTFGYGVLQSRLDTRARTKAAALLDATRNYARRLANHPENAILADATGFSPEGVRAALLGLAELRENLGTTDWHPSSLFGSRGTSALPLLVGVMMRIPELRKTLLDIGFHGIEHQRIAELAQAWVGGQSLENIARDFFSGSPEHPVDLTDAITNACKGIYRYLANAGAWGLSALSKMPTSGLSLADMSDDAKRMINNLPAMLYHGVGTEAAVLMRMNAVPRSVAESLGTAFLAYQASTPSAGATVGGAREFLRSLREQDWQRAAPSGVAMSGSDYRKVWARLVGEAF
jgi:superfamily II DNA/RNA helicase